jgi:hypothetical protein
MATVQRKAGSSKLVVCVENDGYPVSLEIRKIYVAIRDQAAERHGMLRVIDESGEGYLYPKQFFIAVDLPASIRKALLAA